MPSAISFLLSPCPGRSYRLERLLLLRMAFANSAPLRSVCLSVCLSFLVCTRVRFSMQIHKELKPLFLTMLFLSAGAAVACIWMDTQRDLTTKVSSSVAASWFAAWTSLLIGYAMPRRGSVCHTICVAAYIATWLCFIVTWWWTHEYVSIVSRVGGTCFVIAAASFLAGLFLDSSSSVRGPSKGVSQTPLPPVTPSSRSRPGSPSRRSVSTATNGHGGDGDDLKSPDADIDSSARPKSE